MRMNIFAGNDYSSLQVVLALGCKGETSPYAGVRGQKAP